MLFPAFPHLSMPLVSLLHLSHWSAWVQVLIMEAESKESSEISRTRKSRIRQSWSVAAATYVGCCFTEMESDRSLRRRLDRGTGSLSSGAVASGAMVPAGGATAAAPAPGFTGRCLRALSWMGLPWVCQRNSVARHAEPAAVSHPGTDASLLPCCLAALLPCCLAALLGTCRSGGELSATGALHAVWGPGNAGIATSLRVAQRRWVQLAFLALLALVSDLVWAPQDA